jgi:putative NADH-flavin reductase
MTVPTVDRSRLVIVGATGMVGGYALRYALDNSDVGSVTAVGRKTLGIAHPKLKEVLHQDFADCSPLAEILSGQVPPSTAWARIPGQCRTRSCTE